MINNVLIKNSLILILFLIFNIFCNVNYKVKNNLTINLNFKYFGKKQINITDINWKKHKKDTIIYFKFTLDNINKEPFFIKTSLVSINIPILVKYNKAKNNKINLEIIQQFRVLWKDSIVLKHKNLDIPLLHQAFRIGNQKNGINTICHFEVIQDKDIIDISNQPMIRCIDKDLN